MPIKDQCGNCRHQNEEGCTVLDPIFDGTSCDVYHQRTAKIVNNIKFL